MAEPAIVPVKLDVNDISLQGIKVEDVKKDISQKIGNISSSINSMLSNVDTIDFTQKMNNAFASVEKRIVQTMNAQKEFNKVLTQVAASDPTYASYAAEVERLQKSIQALTTVVESFEDSNGNVRSDVLNNATLFATYTARCNDLQQAYTDLQAAQSKIEDPSKFIKLDNLNTAQFDAIVVAYEKIKASVASANAAVQKFNTTSTEGKMTDPYQQYQADADKLTEKLEKLNEKAKQMGQLGATDAQWEKLRYEIDSTQSSIDEVVKKMRKMVNDRSAFRFDFDDEDVKEARSEINKLNREQKKLADSARTIADTHESPYSEQYKEALKQLEKYEKAADKLQDKAEIQLNTGASDEQIARTRAEATQLNDKIQELLDNMRELVNSGDAFKLNTGDATQELESIDNTGVRLENTLTTIGDKSNAVQRLGGRFKELGNNISTSHPILSKIAQVAGSVINGLGSAGKAAKEFGSKVISAASKAKDAFSKITGKIKGVVSGFKNVISKVNIFSKSGKGMSGSFDKGFKKMSKNLLQFGLGFRSMYFLIKRLRKVLTDSLTDIGQQFPEFGAQINSLKQSFNALKGSVGTAFQPLASAVIPVLTKIMDYATTVLEVIGKFNAALTGQNFIYKANAKAIDATTDAKKKSNAEDKKQLASYDKLEVIKEDKDTSSGSSSGNDSGVTYTKESLDGAVSDFAQAVKDAWDKADFTEIGTTVGTKLSSTLDGVQAFITKLDANSVKVGKSLATFINGFTAVDGLGAKLGSAFTGLVNAGIHGISSFVSNVDFASVGTFIGSGINSILTELDLGTVGTTIAGLLNGISDTIISGVAAIDWKQAALNLATGLNNVITGWDPKKAALALSNSVKGIFTYIATALQEVDWQALGTQVATFVASIDWGGVANTIFSALGSAFGAVGGFIAGILKTAIDGIVTWWNTVAFEDGQFTLEGLLNGILEGIANIGAWIWNNIFKPFWEGLKKAFGINSPSKKMKEIGGYLIDGLKNGLSGIWDKIKSIFSNLITNISSKFTAMKDKVKDVVDRLKEAIKLRFESIRDRIKTIAKSIYDNTIGKFSGIKDKVKDTIDKLKESVKTKFDTIKNNIKDKVKPIYDNTVGKFKDIRDKVKTYIDGLKENAKTKFDSIKKTIHDKVKPIYDNTIGKFSDIKTKVTTTMENMKTKLKTIMTNVWTAIKTPINTILSGFQSLVNGVINGVNTMIRALNKLSFDVPSWVPAIGGNKFGFNIPTLSTVSIPKLAKGAVIPPNKEFLAMLGDQNKGTNIEAPLDTIKQALAEVIAEIGDIGNHEPIELKLDGKVVAKVVWDESKKLYKQTGKSYI